MRRSKAVRVNRLLWAVAAERCRTKRSEAPNAGAAVVQNSAPRPSNRATRCEMTASCPGWWLKCRPTRLRQRNGHFPASRQCGTSVHNRASVVTARCHWRPDCRKSLSRKMGRPTGLEPATRRTSLRRAAPASWPNRRPRAVGPPAALGS
jgi:hypothetical protein